MSRKKLYTKRHRREDGSVLCPFSVLIDTSEQNPFLFQNMKTNKDEGDRIIKVNTIGFNLPWADYSIWDDRAGRGLEEDVLIERKAKGDFISSVVGEENRGRFVKKLEAMSKCRYSAVVVEAEWKEIHGDFINGNVYTGVSFKSIYNTILAWDIRYPVKWRMCPSRSVAEMSTFRIFEKFYKEYICDGE